MNKFMEWCICVLLVATISLVVYLCVMLYKDSQSETFTLMKSEWICTGTQEEQSVILVGKVLVPQIRDVCVGYSRIK